MTTENKASQEKAAEKIQELWRGTKIIDEKKDGVRKIIEEELIGKEQAAIAIQRLWRGYKARDQYLVVAKPKDSSDEKDAAARKIQEWWRRSKGTRGTEDDIEDFKNDKDSKLKDDIAKDDDKKDIEKDPNFIKAAASLGSFYTGDNNWAMNLLKLLGMLLGPAGVAIAFTVLATEELLTFGIDLSKKQITANRGKQHYDPIMDGIRGAFRGATMSIANGWFECAHHVVGKVEQGVNIPLRADELKIAKIEMTMKKLEEASKKDESLPGKKPVRDEHPEQIDFKDIALLHK